MAWQIAGLNKPFFEKFAFKAVSRLQSPLTVIRGLFLASAELSGRMRYDGYYLSGHTTKVLPYAAYDVVCWEFCLQETSFLCLALAYARHWGEPYLFAVRHKSSVSLCWMDQSGWDDLLWTLSEW